MKKCGKNLTIARKLEVAYIFLMKRYESRLFVSAYIPLNNVAILVPGNQLEIKVKHY